MIEGLLPRKFEANNPEENIILTEEQEVSEMYFINRGIVGIGFTQLRYDGISPYKIIKRYSKGQVFADHPTFNNTRSKFVYIAIEDMHGFALPRKYIKHHLQPKFPEEIVRIKSMSSKWFEILIQRPIKKAKDTYIK